MSASLEKLERQFDRLERLFSKKKKTSKASQESLRLASSPVAPLSFLDATIFPQPTFIRPTSSRMVAREEVALTPNSTRRARSLPESPSTPRLRTPTTPTTPTGSCQSTTTSKPNRSPDVPQRFSSLGPGIPKRASSLCPGASASDPLLELLEFSFRTTPKKSGSDLTLNRRSRPSSKASSRDNSISVSPKAQAKRKRQSDDLQDRLGSYTCLRQETLVEQQSSLATSPAGSAQTPRESHFLGFAAGFPPPPLSPRLVPLPEPGPDELGNAESQSPTIVSERFQISPLKSTSPPSINPLNLSTISSCPLDSDTTLQEPSLNDFLALSDDDIADDRSAIRPQAPVSKPPIFGLPPHPPAADMHLSAASGYPFITLGPSLGMFPATLPATAAAFEAARIAIKYGFDLVYVVNLWPTRMGNNHSNHLPNFARFRGIPVPTSPTQAPRTPSPPSSPVSSSSFSENDSGFEGSPHPYPRKKSSSGAITGRLLAAYGLPAITYPFRISAPVHQKVLRTEGWLEYRSENCAQDEFARGYSCAFHTGHYSHHRGRHRRERADEGATSSDDTSDATSPTSPLHPPRRTAQAKLANRGVVFAAFRLPRDDGTPIASDTAELDALYRDAELLVDLVTDVHTAQYHQQRARWMGKSGSRRCGAANKGKGKNGGGLGQEGGRMIAA